jgi:hypothetical protein
MGAVAAAISAQCCPDLKNAGAADPNQLQIIEYVVGLTDILRPRKETPCSKPM